MKRLKILNFWYFTVFSIQCMKSVTAGKVLISNIQPLDHHVNPRLTQTHCRFIFCATLILFCCFSPGSLTIVCICKLEKRRFHICVDTLRTRCTWVYICLNKNKRYLFYNKFFWLFVFCRDYFLRVCVCQCVVFVFQTIVRIQMGGRSVEKQKSEL